MHDVNLAVAGTFGSRADAELAKSMLESAGIQSMVEGDTAGGMRDHLAWSGAGFHVWVREEDAAEARELLKPDPGSEEETPDDESDDPWPPWRRFT